MRLKNLLNVRFESHVYHPISFVEYDVSAPIEDQIVILQDVDETTRSGDDNLAAKTQLESLFLARQT